MRNHFIPPSYKREWQEKLQCLEQGNMSVQEYYAEFQKCAIRCGIVEDMEDKIVHFYDGLRHEIQDIVYHKKICTVNRLFQLAMLAEKELQGSQQMNLTNISDNLNHVLARVEQAFAKVETMIRRRVAASAPATSSPPPPPTHTLESSKTLNHAKIVQTNGDSCCIFTTTTSHTYFGVW